MSTASAARKATEKNEKVLRSLQRRKENKRCADCNEKGAQYVCLNFNTFVCTSCSGILREFSFRVKGISMSTFSEEELVMLDKGGNERARDIWMARMKDKHFKYPEASGTCSWLTGLHPK
jgi:Arf-GAP domain and FG repeat-containing protein 1